MPPEPSSAIAVLLATHNGVRWLDEQLASILSQEGAQVRVIALDDASTDGTPELLARWAERDSRVEVMAPMGASGASAANFYRLIQHAPVREDEYVSFADQDDVWLPGKFARHLELLRAGADGVSSSVTSFWPDGRRELVRKNYPMRQWDYLFESPGPGSTFLLNQKVFRLVREVLRSGDADAHGVDYHDSLTYALARASGATWRIDDWPSVDYRQHGGNVMGANSGLRSKVERLRLIGRRWHRGQAQRMARAGLRVAAPELAAGLSELVELTEHTGPRARLKLARMGDQLRRRPRDRRILVGLISIGVW